MVSSIIRRSIQLRAAISVGCDAIGTSASIICGYFTPQSQVCMPPIELPITSRRCLMPSPSLTSRYCASTMSA